jgi:hypothetical protein
MRRTGTNEWKDLFGGHPFAVIVIIGAVLILAIVGTATNWWSSIPHQPKRPSGVPKEAVWISKSKSGHWILCRVKEYGKKAQCTMWDYSGTVAYAGDFRTYKESPLSPATWIFTVSIHSGTGMAVSHASCFCFSAINLVTMWGATSVWKD